MVLYGTCMGSANANSNVNLPCCWPAGLQTRRSPELRHQEELSAAELYVSMLQRLRPGDRPLRSSTGTLRGLKMA